MKLIVVGDVHGYYKELQDALYNAQCEDGDRLIFLGDYIDRGPRSREVMDFLVSLRNPDNIYLRGNHEELLLKALAGDVSAYGVLMDNGFISTLRSYGLDTGTLSCSDAGRHYVHCAGKHILLDNRELPLFLRSVIPPGHLSFIENTLYSFDTDNLIF